MQTDLTDSSPVSRRKTVQSGGPFYITAHLISYLSSHAIILLLSRIPLQKKSKYRSTVSRSLTIDWLSVAFRPIWEYYTYMDSDHFRWRVANPKNTTIINYFYYFAFCYLLIHYTTIMAYCTESRVISLIYVYTMPRPAIEPGTCKSEALPTELCGLLIISLFRDVYKLNDVSNNIILMIKRLSVT